MGILATALTSLLLVPSPAQGPAPAPSAEEIAAFRKELEAALLPDADVKRARRLVLSARDHVDPSVIAVLDARALRHPDLALRDYSADMMGYMRHPDALAALEAMAERDAAELGATPGRHAALLRSIARHGNERSVPLLAAKAWDSPDRTLVAARLLGLANIRARTALDAIVELLRAGPRPTVTEVMPEFRTALFVLSGADHGLDPDAWLAWYDGARETLAVAPEPPAELPTEVRRRWQMFWGPPRDNPKRTFERGKEPARKGAKERVRKGEKDVEKDER